MSERVSRYPGHMLPAVPDLVRRAIAELAVLLDPPSGREGLTAEGVAAVEALCREVLTIKDRAYAHASDADRRAAEAIRRAGDCAEHAKALTEMSEMLGRLDRNLCATEAERKIWVDGLFHAVQAYPDLQPLLDRVSRAAKRCR